MASVPSVENAGVLQSPSEEDEKERVRGRYRQIISTLPAEKCWRIDIPLYQYQGFWYYASAIEGIMWVQQHFTFTPRKEDVLLASFPKSGTTWLKSLAFSIMNLEQHLTSSHRSLTSSSPHELVPFLEYHLHQNIPFPDPYASSSPPHLFHTHIPFTSLPQPLVDSQCRIIYICRNPKDVFVSTFFFRPKGEPLLSIEDAFNKFCRGISVFGPLWDHMLGYWKESLASPDRILFMKYEDVKRDPKGQVKRLAEFVGRPLSSEGLIEEIVEMCSFENLRNLRANKTGAINLGGARVGKDAFFRKGETGDWKNHLTVEMADRLDRIVEETLGAYGLTFND